MEGLETRITPAAAHPIADLADPDAPDLESVLPLGTFRKVGDVDGDGLDDLVLLSRHYHSYGIRHPCGTLAKARAILATSEEAS